MLDNIANACPDNLSYNDIVWANSASDNCLCAIRFYMENCLNENNDPISPDSATRFDHYLVANELKLTIDPYPLISLGTKYIIHFQEVSDTYLQIEI